MNGESTTDRESVALRDEEASGDVEAIDGLPPEVFFEVLRNERRRRVLRFLRSGENPVTLRALAEHVAAHENGKPPEALGSQERKRVYVALYQCHLPKMDDLDFVHFDKARGRVELGPRGPLGCRYLDVPESSRTPSRSPLWLAGAGLVVVVLTTLLPGPAPAAVSAVGPGLIAIATVIAARRPGDG